MVTIYKDYGDEPDPVFLPLPEELACRFYDLEMEAFAEDIPFYQEFLPVSGTVLEIGCGSGRVARRLASKKRPVIGIDLSPAMAVRAAGHGHPHCRFLVMDMLSLGLCRSFTAVLVPYNTLNLLAEAQTIARFLRSIHHLLDEGGVLLLQLFIPTTAMFGSRGTTFQFQLFDLPEGGRMVKEIRTTLQAASSSLVHEERFRLRPTGADAVNRDYRTIRTITALPFSAWRELWHEAGFTLQQCWGDYHPVPYDQFSSPLCLLVLEKKSIKSFTS
jgi:SAM-dependent methyltransferase